MVYTCFLCKWRSDKLPRRSYHKFPSDSKLKQKWLNILGKSDVSVGTRTSLCSLHFDESCFRYGLVHGRKILKDGSLPTLHLTRGDVESQTTPLLDKIVLPSPSPNNLILIHGPIKLQSAICSKLTNALNQGLDHDDANSDLEDIPGTSSQNVNRDSASGGNEITVFCPKCNTEVPHTAEGIQEDQTKILVAKVYHYFEQEFEELKKMYGDLDLTPLSRFRQRTALATGVSETTVLQILDEEQGRNADKRQEPPQKRRIATKRSRQTDSSSEEDSLDDNVDDGGRASVAQLAQKEPEIETLVVKIEPPEYYKEDPLTDPILLEVKAEPPDEDVNNSTNETLALNEPAGTKRKGRKIPRRSDVTSTRQHIQGESSTTAAASSAPLTEQLHESGLLGATEVKLENIEVGEEGFS